MEPQGVPGSTVESRSDQRFPHSPAGPKSPSGPPTSQYNINSQNKASTNAQNRMQQNDTMNNGNNQVLLGNHTGPGGQQQQSAANGPQQQQQSVQKERKLCKKCGRPLSGQFVRALDAAFHLECFTCHECGDVVASKFFPAEDAPGSGQYPLCERDYFRRLDLLCAKCGEALRGSYVTALDHKYHIDHFTCSVCPMQFGAADSYYEHDNQVFCHYHYSTRFAQRCHGCRTAILKQFVEIFRQGVNQHWHPECYMIHKFWNVRLALPETEESDQRYAEGDVPVSERERVRVQEEQMEEKVYRIWAVLSAFEESSAACISDMLLHVSNGAYVDGVVVAKSFIMHVDLLFSAIDRLDTCVKNNGLLSAGKGKDSQGLQYGREAKLLCKKIVGFFTLLSRSQESGVRRLGVTQELLSLVTSLAHYLKLLIRISLQGALKLEREKQVPDGLYSFLEELAGLEKLKEKDTSLDADDSSLAEDQADLCFQCQSPIENEGFKAGDKKWHMGHLQCATCGRQIGDQLGVEGAKWSEYEKKAFCPDCVGKGLQPQDAVTGITYVSRLQQYVYLLRVALARLLHVLRSGGTLPHTSDDPNLAGYNSEEGHRVPARGQLEPRKLSLDSRSKSYSGTPSQDRAQQSSYEETVGEMKRLRSTRMEKHLSTTMKRARTSRIIDGPEGQSIAAGQDPTAPRSNGFHIIESQDPNGESRRDLMFGKEDGLTLDDIPRIVAAEQAKEQRPNAFKYAHNQLGPSGPQPKLKGINERAGGPGQTAADHVQRPKKFFSELTALEYFIVRHVAVLQMQPLLEGSFTLEDLMSLVEVRKTTFWSKFGKTFNKKESNKAGKKKGVFGVALENLLEKDGVESTHGVGPGALRVPNILDDSVSAMRQMDMSVEGVFRKNGNIRRSKELSEKYDMNADVDLSKENPVQVAALLKKFLRELPEPLLTYKLHDLFIASQKIADEDKRRRVLHLTCCLLPKTHRDSMEILSTFLNWAASFAQVDEEGGSKMDSRNIATVITPNILSANNRETSDTSDTFLAIEAVCMLIDFNDQFCVVPDDIQSVLGDRQIFENMPEVTTKEILRRYGDIVTKPGPKVDPGQQETFVQRSESAGRRPAAAVTRVDSDNKQAHAWQREASVRHVQPNGAGTPGFASQSSFHNTPPPPGFDFANPNSPYHLRQGSSESAGSYAGQSRHNYRPSALAHRPAPPGASGVPNTS